MKALEHKNRSLRRCQKKGTVSPRRLIDLDLKGFWYSALVTVPIF
jgi:hypothetical protein